MRPRHRPDADGGSASSSKSNAAARCARPLHTTEGKPQGGLKPWREASPRTRRRLGRYQRPNSPPTSAGSTERGLRRVQTPHRGSSAAPSSPKASTLAPRRGWNACRHGGDPVVELQTNFGGGKTHSMLPSGMLLRAAPARCPPSRTRHGGRNDPLPAASGARSSSAQDSRPAAQKRDATVVRTLWGDLPAIGGKGLQAPQAGDERAPSRRQRSRPFQ